MRIPYFKLGLVNATLALTLSFFGLPTPSWAAVKKPGASPSPWVLVGGHPAHPTRILAAFKGNAIPDDASTFFAGYEARIDRRFPAQANLVLLEDTASPVAATPEERAGRLSARIAALQATERFEYVEPDYARFLTTVATDQAFTNGILWGLYNNGTAGGVVGADISITNAWDATTGSSNVLIAVLDTGIRYTHVDLTNNVWVNPGEIAGNGLDDDNNGYVDDIHGINTILQNGNPMDSDDHGTHVSGTIGASANDAGRHVGVCWNVRIMGIRALSGSGGTVADVVAGLDYAVANGAKVVNESLGSYSFSTPEFQSISRARAAGVLVIAASGNDALNTDLLPHYPSCYNLDNIISVGASDRRDNLSDFSNYGFTSVDLVGPGTAIFSTISTSDTAYEIFDGTSMATPHVTGVAALILSLFPTADIGELKARILDGVEVLPSMTGFTVTGGRLNAYRALNITSSGLLQMRVTPPNGSALLQNTTQTIRVEVTDPPLGVTDATVTANIVGGGSVSFRNDGVAPDALANDKFYTGDLAVPNNTDPITLVISATAPGKIGTTNSITYQVVARPGNDDLAKAIKAPAGITTYYANNLFATMEAGEPSHAGVATAAASLWWNFTPTTTGPVFIDTTGSAVDTIVAVYTGVAVSNLTAVASVNDVGTARQAYLNFNATAQTAYRIAVSSVNTNQLGSIQLRIAPGGDLDTTIPLVAITAPLDGTVVTTNTIALSGTASDPAPNSTGVSEVLISVNGSFGSLASGTTNWSRLLLLQPGMNTISVRSADASGNLSSPATIQINYFIPPPANDYFVGGKVVTNLVGTTAFDTTQASLEPGEPVHAGVAGGKSLWYRFTAPADGTVVLATVNPSFDTLLGLYTGNSVAALTQVASNDDAPGAVGGESRVEQAVQGGVTYHIAVDGYAGAAGTGTLSNYFAPKSIFTVTVGSAGGGVVSPTTTLVGSNGTVTITATPDSGYLFDMWSGSVSSVANPLTVTVLSNLSLTAHFRPVSYTDGFETGNLTYIPWQTSGSQPWVVQTNVAATGSFAARSGPIGNAQSSSLLYSGNFQSGDVSFACRVSSEAGYDWLRFIIDGVVQESWSGETGWVNYSLPLTAGTHTLEWRYVKDASLTQGADAAYLDNVVLPLVVTNLPAFQARMQIRYLSEGATVVDLTGQPNQIYQFQYSENLSHWTTFATEVATGGFARAVDANAGNQRRYYRALAPVQ